MPITVKINQDLPADVATLKVEACYLRQELERLRRLIVGQKQEWFVPMVIPEQWTMGLDDPHGETAPCQVEPICYPHQKGNAHSTPPGGVSLSNLFPATPPNRAAALSFHFFKERFGHGQGVVDR